MLRAFPGFISGRPGAGLLVLRVLTGLAMVVHGFSKIQNAFGWMGADSWDPGWLQALAAGSEFFGGMALALGLLTPLAAFLLACTMATAILTVHAAHGQPWIGKGGSFELPMSYLGVCAMFLLTGPGRFSIDYLLFGKERPRASSEKRARETVGGWR
jgi:putative oxidoreductase